MFFKKKEEVRDIIKEVYAKDKLERYAKFILGVFIVALSFNLFVLPSDIVYGVSGVGVILNKMYGINPSTTIFIGEIALLILSFIVLGKEKTKNSIIGSILYPIFVELTTYLTAYIDVGNVEPIVMALFGAVISGFGFGMIFKSGYTTGGTDILNQIVSKYGKVSLGNAMLVTDGLIILGGICTFGVSKIMYSIINLYIVSMMTDKVMIGVSQSKSFFIITSKESEIKKFILGQLGHGVTVLEGNGAFSGNKQKVLMCVIPTREYFVAKEGIHEIDPNAFFVVSDAYEVHGNK
ncbi:MAG: YitT family protein [Lactobacillales bacterium]|nr:YitT family protein [Lactobacillales bacterium]